MWKRRHLYGSLVALGACNGAASAPPTPTPKPPTESAPAPATAPTKASPVSPTTPSPTRPGTGSQSAGFSVQNGPAPFELDGDRLIELRDGAIVIRALDAKLGESARIAVPGAVAFTVLPDHSLLVMAKGAGPAMVHHVVGTAIKASYEGNATPVRAAETPASIWRIDGKSVYRDKFGTGKFADMMLPEKTFKLPDGPLGAYARLADGSLVVATQSALVRIGAAGATSYEWEGYSRHVGPGPDADSVWVSDSLTELAIVKLAGTTATATAKHALKPGETIAHLASAGAHAAAVLALTGGPKVKLAVAVWSASGELWRADLGDETGIYHVAIDGKHVVVRADPRGQHWAFDAATGTPL